MIEIPAVSEQSPWLGLNPFTEDLQQFFHGRDAEAGDLFRRVKRRRLTVLFGQSGLGKTSLVQAGLFPQLRPTFLPVTLRLDYSSKAPAPTMQIKQAVYNAMSAVGLTTKSTDGRRDALGVLPSPRGRASHDRRHAGGRGFGVRPVRRNLHGGHGRNGEPAAS